MTDEDLIDELQYGYPICRQAATRIKELLALVEAQRSLIVEARESISVILNEIGASHVEANENTTAHHTDTQH